jgi:hypothetical protein
MTRKFAHVAEEQFAKILNFYEIEWQYEPTMFILRTDEEGMIRKGFTPDFYIPEYDVYVEITVMGKPQKKRKKIAETNNLYPDVNIILMNRSDMEGLRKKYDFLFC